MITVLITVAIITFFLTLLYKWLKDKPEFGWSILCQQCQLFDEGRYNSADVRDADLQAAQEKHEGHKPIHIEIWSIYR